MAMGRFGQVVSPLIAGSMLGYGLGAPEIMLVVGAGGLIAAVFVVLFRIWIGGHSQITAAELKANAA
jgi:hypothetical protein